MGTDKNSSEYKKTGTWHKMYKYLTTLQLSFETSFNMVNLNEIKKFQIGVHFSSVVLWCYILYVSTRKIYE
jgi:hypothetical protein